MESYPSTETKSVYCTAPADLTIVKKSKIKRNQKNNDISTKYLMRIWCVFKH